MDELLHYEWAELAIDTDEADPFPDASQPDMPEDEELLEWTPIWSPVAWPLIYQWPVHQLSADMQPTEPPETPTCVLVYRDRDNRVQFMALNPMSALLCQSLSSQENVSTHSHLKALNHQFPQIPEDNLIAGGIQLIRELCTKGAITHLRPINAIVQ